MTPKEFIAAVRQVVYESAINGALSLISRPPGRRPPRELLALSKWFASLSENDKKLLRSAIAIGAHQATFGILAVLDGARQISDSSKKGKLELYYVEDDRRTLLNSEEGASLHDLLNQNALPY